VIAPTLIEAPWLLPDPRRPGQVLVKLTPGELADAQLKARERHAESRVKRGRVQRHDPGEGKYEDVDLQGTLAEKAVNKLLDSYWHGAFIVGDRLPEDDGGWETKGTRWPNGRLLVHEDSKGTVPGVLAIIKEPFVRIPGWLWVEQGKDKTWWDKTLANPCYAVPQNVLYPVSELIAWRARTLAEELGRRVRYCKEIGA
jgi:hypothetical protein